MTLTDAELSRWIAEKLFPWDETRCRICGWKLVANILDGCTPKSCSMRPPPVRHADTPADMIHDPAMTVMLLEKGNLTASPFGDEPRWRVFLADKFSMGNDAITWTLNDDNPIRAHHANLGRAVAEAWALANGWRE